MYKNNLNKTKLLTKLLTIKLKINYYMRKKYILMKYKYYGKI